MKYHWMNTRTSQQDSICLLRIYRPPEYQKQITEERKKEYETREKGIKDIENYKVKQAELSNRTSLASLGYYATDTDKAVAAQQLTKQKLAASNAAIEYAKKRSIDIFTDKEMSEERVKNL